MGSLPAEHVIVRDYPYTTSEVVDNTISIVDVFKK